MSVAEIERAFEAALLRLCKASTDEEQRQELSNMLNDLFRLSEVTRKAMGDHTFHEALTTTDVLRTARAAVWARTFQVHDDHLVGRTQDLYTDYLTNLYGVLAWEPRANLPSDRNIDKYRRHKDYESLLEGRPVLDTLRVAFDAVRSLEVVADPVSAGD